MGPSIYHGVEILWQIRLRPYTLESLETLWKALEGCLVEVTLSGCWVTYSDWFGATLEKSDGR